MNKDNQELVNHYSNLAVENSNLNPELFIKYDVKKGLRDISGRGVLAGLTRIGEVKSYIMEEGEMVPVPGKLLYRGYDIKELVGSASAFEGRATKFEEVSYLLLTGELPTRDELDQFCKLLGSVRSLPEGFDRDIIMKAPSQDMMNALARSVLALYSYDATPDNTAIPNLMRQSIELISNFSVLVVYAYQSFEYYFRNKSLIIHKPDISLGVAENILHMLRADNKYSPLEARLLDLALVLHAEHGGGNNSTFATRVVSSSGTDTYSVIAAALGSLKGPRHGGANIKVVQMFRHMKKEIKDWSDKDEVSAYLYKLLRKETFDHSGLIYGVGHAVYSISDPRAEVFKEFVRELAGEKGKTEEFKLYELVEVLAPEIIGHERKMYKGVSINVDFYSGFVYEMLGIPEELYTPVFAIARIAGWCAHRIEEISNAGKIIRPAYKSIEKKREYIPIDER